MSVCILIYSATNGLMLADNVSKHAHSAIVLYLYSVFRLQESSDAAEENERLKQTIKHKEERVRILQVSLDQNQQEINSLESR